LRIKELEEELRELEKEEINDLKHEEIANQF